MSTESLVIDDVENYLSENYEFRLNVATGRCEFKRLATVVTDAGEFCRRPTEGQFTIITDYDENSIIRELRQNDFRVSKTLLRTTLLSDFSTTYDPFHEYLRHLPKWDGGDYIEQLAATVRTTDHNFWNDCLKRWLVAMVGSLLDEKVVNHTVLVLAGEQGVGKTTWLQNLVPTHLKKYMYSGTLSLNNKDTLIHLSECMLINLDELENLNRTQIGALKEIITKSGIRLRKAYGRNSEVLRRRASFTASVNDKQFLHDSTGNRRFLSIEVTGIDYKQVADLDKIYSQALHLFRNGFKFWFGPEEMNTLNKNNEQYEQVSFAEEMLLGRYQPVEEPFPADVKFMTTTNLAEQVFNRPSTDSLIQKLGKALNKHKFRRVKRGGLYVYAVQRRG